MGAALPVALGLQVGGSLLAAKSAQDKGNSDAAYYNFLGLQSDQNAGLIEAAGEADARSVNDKGATDLGKLRESVRATEGTQTAALAANGVAGSVTAEDIARDTRSKAALDELAIRYNADLKSGEIRRSSKFEAMNKRFEGAGYRVAGANARATGKASAILSLVGGASQVATTAYGARR